VSEYEVPDESVDALLERASGPATPDELSGADAAIARFVGLVAATAATAETPAIVDTQPIDVQPDELSRVRRLRPVRVPARAAAIVAIATLWSTGMAAAATGHLPNPVQRAVSHTASHVGLNLPDAPDDQDVKSAAEANGQSNKKDDGQGDDTSTSSTATTTPPTTGATTTGATTTAAAAASTTGGPTTSAAGASTSAAGGHVRGVGPDVTGPAGDALCKAYIDAIARGKPKNPDAPPWRNLLEASKTSGKSIDELCGVAPATTVAPTSGTSPSSTSTTSTTSTSSTLQAEGTSNGGNDEHGGGNGGGNGNGNGGGNGNGNGNGNGHTSNP
jgi:hypothetical protein